MAVARFQLFSVLRSAEQGVTWRFLSANNRSIGQSAAVHPDAESCATSIRDLLHRLDDAVVVTTRDGQQWLWRVRHAGVDLAVSSRLYHRRVQARYASTSFLELVGGAQFADLPRVVYF